MLPGRYRQRIGTALLSIARHGSPNELRLLCCQRSNRAHAFHKPNGFAAGRFSTGSRNEQREPDLGYVWSRIVWAGAYRLPM